MMKRLIVVLGVITLTLLFVKCSMMGYGLGKTLEDEKPIVVYDGWRVDSILPGTKMTLLLSNGRELEGRYIRHASDIDAETAASTISFKYIREVPSSTSMKAKIDPIIQIPIGSIRQVTIEHEGAGRYVGLAIGALIDAGILVAVISEATKPDPPPSSYSLGSCPLVYSYDGNEYTLEAEPMGGAIFQAAQFTELDRMEDLKVVNGSYTLRICNQPEESQFIDQLQLHTIHHPIGTEVLPSSDLRILMISDPLPPMTAISMEGDEVTARITDRDEHVWVASPFNRDPGNPEDLRTGLIVEFPKPEHTDMATLILTLQNTHWTSYLQKQYLALHGDELEHWYNLLNTSKDMRENFRSLMIREAMLLIKVWDGTSWIDQGHIWGVGPAVSRDLAHSLDLSGSSQKTLTIKLEAPPGLWMVDRLAIDYGGKSQTRIENLPLIGMSASSPDLQDEAAIRDADHDYLILTEPDDFIDLTWLPDQPPNDEKQQETLMLRTSGYYYMHYKPTGPPQHDLLKQVQEEPYFFTRLALQALNYDFERRPI